jgi:hypothetical protein
MKKSVLWMAAIIAILGIMVLPLASPSKDVQQSTPDHIVSLYWIEARSDGPQEKAPEAGPPISILSKAGKTLLSDKDLAPDLASVNKHWGFKQIGSVSAPVLKEAGKTAEATADPAEGRMSLKTLSSSYPEKGRTDLVSITLGYDIKSNSGDGISSNEYTTSALEVGKAYLISMQSEADFSKSLMVFVAVSDAKEQ